MKKGQAANEMAAIIGFMTLFVILIMGAVGGKLLTANDNSITQIADDVADVVESELSLAASAEDGYIREFTLPSTISNIPYSITLLNASATKGNFSAFNITLAISTGVYERVKVMPANVVGTLAVGKNRVVKNLGTANVTQP
jgi:hypothetical protein